MECLWIPLLTIFFLSCRGRPQREDSAFQRKQELILKAEQLRALSLQEPCWLGRDRRPIVNPQNHPLGAYPIKHQWHRYKTTQKELDCQAHGSETCGVDNQKKEKNKHRKSLGVISQLKGRAAWEARHSSKNHILFNKHMPKNSNKYKRSAKKTAEIFNPTAKKGRYPRDADFNVSGRILPNFSLPALKHQKLSSYGSIYFSGVRSQLVLNPDGELRIPRERFTLELWVKPDGGQNDPAVIASMFDNCSHTVSDRGWSLGIRPSVFGAKREAHFYFSLRTDRSPNATILMSPHRYKPNIWTHLAASYDGHKVLFYINGIQVSKAQGQWGSLHSPYISLCRTLMLGGDNSEAGHCFRGHIFSVRLWPEPRTQNQLREEALRRSTDGYSETPLFMNCLSTLLGNLWIPFKEGGTTEVVPELVPEIPLTSPLLLPPCGRTSCDLPDVTNTYSRSEGKWKKEVHYRVVNLCEDDGSRPLVSDEQIMRQHQALIEAYNPHGIHWQLNIQRIHNSTLRTRVVLPGCEPGRVGNEHCDPECRHPLTGYDGGDCGYFRPCNPRKKGDGICHLECNTARDDYDDGDCCPPQESGRSSKTCFDPDAKGRAYMSVKELRDALHLNGSIFLNIYFAGSAGEELAGAATWPWDKEALSHQGGVVLNPAYYGMPGHTNTMIHEVGHVLGLYHVFKGVSERESCDDPCSETEPSMETGDLCADTAPTPKNKLCRDPDPTNDTCGTMFYTGTPYNNYMSYSDDDCTNSFTPNQVARMHCYLDLKYQGWTRSQKPSPIPLPPIVVKQSLDSLTIHWLPPISGELFEREPGSVCAFCAADGSFQQYAYQASSSRVCDYSGYWTPEEAVGPPDVDRPCEPSLQAWSPELHLYHTNMSVPCPQPQGCMLELKFQKPVLPQTLTIWITYLSHNLAGSVSDIEVLLDHGETIHMGSMEAFCDMPLTIRLATEQNVYGVRIFTFDELMEIDAALLVSMPHSPFCSSCKPVRYRVLRDPPFQRDRHGKWTQTHRIFTDREVTPGHRYHYQVQVVTGTEAGEPSPPLIHVHGDPFCGDGEIHEELGEECDDGALHDGDGCSAKCLREPNYSCHGEPSLCFLLNGDSTTELADSRIEVSANYLGQTSHRYIDQWALQATSSLQDSNKCPVLALSHDQVQKGCKPLRTLSGAKNLSAWFLCSGKVNVSMEQDIWLKVNFEKPSLADMFFVYLAADGSIPGSAHKSTVTAHLTDVMGHNHSLGTHELSCQKNPLVLNRTSDPKNPMYNTASVTLRFSSPLVGVSGVAVRSRASSQPRMGYRSSPEHEDCSSCPTLNILHGSAHCSLDGDGDTQCTVTCDKGYAILAVSKRESNVMQTAVLKCSFGHWNMSVTCEPLDCESPSPSLVFHATFSCPDGTGLGKRCSFHCLPPAKFQGMSQWVTCMWDGLWSLPEGYCKLECEAPPAIAHGKLLTPRCLLDHHDVGSMCRYRCKPGYHVADTVERRTKRKFLKIQCLQTGLWSVGRCIPVMCDPLPPILQGMYNCTRGLEVDSKCTLYCGSHTVSTVCSKDGTWTERLSLCEGLQGTCNPPLEINSIHYTCDQGHTIGSVCTASCIYPPSDPVVLPENITADTMEHWMTPIKVQSIMCTGTLKWQPDPASLHCILSCEPFLADGWCDTINNRAYCQYDGGDCCASTLSSHKGQVIPFAADCEEDECTCRDPDAEENRAHRKDLN
ncbi:pappalysin-2 [Spea bombifrons]|uniref:pappalysin-2 n=1 Tax=Spea bombifrons TaxID=233779 RepID=UPI002349B069|nr:pappalysin-2 [Spea bombifrons]